MNKDLNVIKGYNWGRSHIELEFEGSTGYEFRPIEVHLKEDGSLKNEPSLCIVMVNPILGRSVYGQMSVEMFNKALNEIGYKIEKL